MFYLAWTVGYVLAQVILLSATMPTDVLDVTRHFMRDPINILVKNEELTLEGIRQFYVKIESEVSLNIKVLVILYVLCLCHDWWTGQDLGIS